MTGLFQGVNLAQLKQSKQFVFVDCLTKLLLHLWKEEESAGNVVSRGSTLTFSVDRYILPIFPSSLLLPFLPPSPPPPLPPSLSPSLPPSSLPSILFTFCTLYEDGYILSAC